jgi:hypothetical protein
MGIRARWESEQEAERSKKKDEQHDDKPKSKRRSGNYGPLYVLGFAFVAVMIFPLLQTFGNAPVSSYPVMPMSSNLDVRASQLALEQENLHISMTQVAALSTSQAQAVLDQIAQQQNAVNTQSAAITSTVAVQATSTSWSLTQTPLAQEQLLRNIEIDKAQRDAYWRQYTSPLYVVGGALLAGVFLVVLIILGVKAFFQLLPVIETRLRTIKEDGRERTIHLGEKAITRTDLMMQPTLTTQDDGTMKPSGGAADPYMQERIADRAAQVKAVQSLPPGTKIPGNVPMSKIEEKVLPQLDIVDAEEIKPMLLKDVRQSLDGEEGGS